jgi:hypothetical protein
MGWEITSVLQGQVKETFSQATKIIKLFSFKLPDAISLAITKISVFQQANQVQASGPYFPIIDIK